MGRNKKSVSPYKNLKLPALTSNKNVHNHSIEDIKRGRENLMAYNSKSVHSSASRNNKYSKKALDMIYEIDQEKTVKESGTLHEFIVLTLSKSFKAKPRIADKIWSNNFKFLNVFVVKAKKNESYCIRKWYKFLNKFMPSLVEVILNDNPQRIETQIYNALDIIKVGIFSQDAETVKL